MLDWINVEEYVKLKEEA